MRLRSLACRTPAMREEITGGRMAHQHEGELPPMFQKFSTTFSAQTTRGFTPLHSGRFSGKCDKSALGLYAFQGILAIYVFPNTWAGSTHDP